MPPTRCAARPRSFVATLLIALVTTSFVVAPASAAPAPIDDPPSERATSTEIALVTQAYVEQFWPLWLSFVQASLLNRNTFFGPDEISPLYKAIVAINDDTLYASSVVDVNTGPGGQAEPVIVTIPAAGAELSYSVLSTTMAGDVFDSGIPSKRGGVTREEIVYSLVPEGYVGPVPVGSVRVERPARVSTLIIRTDRYVDGVERIDEGNAFREALRVLPLTEYNVDPSGGATRILPEAAFGGSYKFAADTLVQTIPVTYLRQLQTSVQSPNTPPLTAEEIVIAAEFDALFGAGGANVNPVTRVAFARGAQDAHDAIVANYLDNTDENNWIHFTNIGKWAEGEALDRSSIAEFIQYGNDISTAAYYHAFLDGDGTALTGETPGGYVLTFPPGEQPPNERFWSLTAYTPQTIELIDNPIDKYVVASYTPGLEQNPDGSVSIYIAEEQPEGIPEANWLPVSDGAFNVMLRIYGVPADSSVSNNTYRPPPVLPRTSITMLDESARLLDTRPGRSTADGQFAGVGKIQGGTFIEVPIAGRAGIPSSEVEAVVMNATATNADERGFIVTYPCGQRPLASSLNYSIAESAVANELIAELSPDGSICAYANTTTDLVLDAVGYTATTTTYNSIAAARLLETRAGQNTVDAQLAGGGRIEGGTIVEVPVLGRGEMPTSGVDTVVLNATATNAVDRGFITLYSCGDLPVASSLNYPAGGAATANEVIAEVSEGGSVCAHAHTTTDLLLDAVGYFPSTPTYTSQQPARLLETRPGLETIDGRSAGGGPIDGGTFVEVPVLGRGDIPSSGVETIVLNATATNAVDRGFITLYSCGELPLASSLNYPGGDTAVANEVIAKVSADGSVCAYANTTTDLLLDAVGFVPST